MTDIGCDIGCDICGDLLNEQCTVILKCNHSFHYECVFKSFQQEKKKQNACPLCRQIHGLLPIVNGLSKLTHGIHYIEHSSKPDLDNKPCNVILKSGKRKGDPCNASCMLGLHTCKRHHLSTLKHNMNKTSVSSKSSVSGKAKQVFKVNKLGDDLEQVQVEQLLDVTGLVSHNQSI